MVRFPRFRVTGEEVSQFSIPCEERWNFNRVTRDNVVFDLLTKSDFSL